MKKPIAIFCADIHLSHTPPVARSAEPDWYAAMARPLRELNALATKHGCPVLCAGDIYDRWNSSPELINFAIDELPQMYAVPGQHDLPLHRLDDIKKSAYWTLVKSGKVIDMWFDKKSYTTPDWVIPDVLHVLGFPWGKELHGIEGREDYPDSTDIQMALIHRYIWTKGASYPGAPVDQKLSSYSSVLQGYDYAVFGDNHIGFMAKSGDSIVVNCGCMIPRKSDERNCGPSVWLLGGDKSVRRHKLDTSQDRWLEPVEAEALEGRNSELDEFVAGLEELETDSLDFRDGVLRYIEDNKVSSGVRSAIMNAMEGGD